ncbi:MAG: rhodanese-like domain-containing protein [Ferruginibacter sp.]|jgi:rhodanese-related sulfurtransferase|nr:rhodanese-like domain-containing protein [Ferruginibacter sp.]
MELIQPEELKKRMDNNENINLVDVRELSEHTAYNIGGKLIPLGQILSMQLEDIYELKDQEIIFYCRSGNRSAQACLMLEPLGFKNVKNLVGGMLAWQEKFPG